MTATHVIPLSEFQPPVQYRDVVTFLRTLASCHVTVVAFESAVWAGLKATFVVQKLDIELARHLARRSTWRLQNRTPKSSALQRWLSQDIFHCIRYSRFPCCNLLAGRLGFLQEIYLKRGITRVHGYLVLTWHLLRPYGKRRM